MAKLRFDANIPVELALKNDTGVRKSSLNPEWPDQMFYSLCGDDCMYLPLHVAEIITQMGIRKMELISICKRVQGKDTKWEVKRIGDSKTAPLVHAIDDTPLARDLKSSINQVQQRKTSDRQNQTSSATSTMPAQLAAEPAPQDNPTPVRHTIMSRIMGSALCAAIDACEEAQIYAETKGLDIEFGPEDYRAISNTIFIALSKDPRFTGTPQQVNGGAQPWRQ